ncbi:L28 family ribosomal protein [Candidatus Carsonella ruddii]|uniref:Ribosomal protein L28 n=1 Tax=Candidatus Carsonella ruddii HC isolate Thao2000 TaxID=1202538 RepID=J3YQ52_CARRU|nr:L28 family ribosomal protein [Candidatus Carsonella ruddii]AFP83983.1 ribosomal protein L28 [Candidatus Carsonella ruddii HC isolate Thao2000]
MSNICILTKKKKNLNNKISHSNIKSKSFNKINFKNIFIWIKKNFKNLKISTKSIKIIKKCIF